MLLVLKPLPLILFTVGKHICTVAFTLALHILTLVDVAVLENGLPLSMVKNYMLGDMCRSYESAFSLADAWIFVQVSGLQDTYFAEALDAVKEVTPQEIRELAGRHLCKEKLKEIVCGKKMS